MVGTFRHNAAGAEVRLRRTRGLFGPAREVDAEVALEAARLRARHASLRLPDALVIATGIVDDAGVLTCDTRWAGVDARVRVVEPT